MPEELVTPQPEKQKHSTPDGPRFVASIQDAKDKSLYKDFFESEKLGETKLRAEQEVAAVGRPALIFDRHEHWVIDKILPEGEAVEPPKEEKPSPKRRGRPKKSG
jgi:hypothetical protein